MSQTLRRRANPKRTEDWFCVFVNLALEQKRHKLPYDLSNTLLNTIGHLLSKTVYA